jgi:hypothetical protein
VTTFVAGGFERIRRWEKAGLWAKTPFFERFWDSRRDGVPPDARRTCRREETGITAGGMVKEEHEDDPRSL